MERKPAGWFRRHSRDNVVLAVIATIGAAIARHKVIVTAMGAAVCVVLVAVLVSDRGSPGTQQVRAAEPATTAVVETSSDATSTLDPPAAPPDTIPPSLLLDPSLTEGLTVGTDHLVVSGVTEPGASVVVAGITLVADDTGTWSADVPLALGPNRIDVVVTDRAGNATGAAFTVVHAVDAPPPPAPKTPRRVIATTTSTVAPPSTNAATTTAHGSTSPSATTATATTATTATTTTVATTGGFPFPTTPATTAATTTAPTTTAPTSTADTTPTTEAPTTTEASSTTADTTPTTEATSSTSAET